MKILTRDEIMERFSAQRATEKLIEGFIRNEEKRVQIPAPQNFRFDDTDGDCCVKSAHVSGEPTFFVKISTGFYQNPSIGLHSNNGLIVGLSANTGEPVVLLRDDGWLTSVRTALAGAIVARLMAPDSVHCIGIVGTGEQARLQLQYLRDTTQCRSVTVWGRGIKQLDTFCDQAVEMGFDLTPTLDAEEVARRCNLIITTTPSRVPILKHDWIQPGTHITAVGADGPGKQELDARIIGTAQVVLVDSLDQCSKYGELSHALNAGLCSIDRVITLGAALTTRGRVRTSSAEITVADLTGVAVQDAAIAASVLPGD